MQKSDMQLQSGIISQVTVNKTYTNNLKKLIFLRFTIINVHFYYSSVHYKMSQMNYTLRYDDDLKESQQSICQDEKELISARRDEVLTSYDNAVASNRRRFLEKDDKATSQYIFPNQKEDAMNIVNEFYRHNRRVISIQKKTKVGADGLMIEICKILTTHIDDNFIVNPENVRILTGMSNATWEKDMKDKSPSCFKDKIFHHGQLKNADLKNLKNGLIIVDEIDTGDKEYQVLHNTLKDAGILNIQHMINNNIRFVFISATSIKELYELYRWGDLHCTYSMTIPPTYVGHQYFLDKKIIQEFYDLSSISNVEKWIDEIISYYRTDNPDKPDYRVHIVRVGTNKKIHSNIQDECIRRNLIFENHTSSDRLSREKEELYFKSPLTQHIIVAIKGLFRRANLIPNSWKLRIGATHELYTKKVDDSVQIQGLTGRMTGYWKDELEKGHKTGPHRTCIESIIRYELTYKDPFGKNSYNTSQFTKKDGKVTKRHNTFVSNPDNLVKGEYPDASDNTIPVKMIVTNNDLLEKIINVRVTLNPKEYKPQLHKLLIEGINSNKISIFDKNNNNKKFNIRTRFLNQVRMYKTGDDISSRRFKSFNDSYENCKSMSQSGDKNQYNIDMAKDEYIHEGFTNHINTMWITFKI